MANSLSAWYEWDEEDAEFERKRKAEALLHPLTYEDYTSYTEFTAEDLKCKLIRE